MGNLILNSLEIRNFRCFKHLQIERLGRVNLIVGKNNVGKSTLLEALRLYAYKGSPNLIWKILQSRDESRQYNRKRIERSTVENLLLDLKHLCYG
jgi:AAA15 family ATPase/GTPase